MKFTQMIDNLPDEIISQKRFFNCKDKIPCTKDWSNPDVQRRVDEIDLQNYTAGFDISGHDVAPDYLLVDFDHVIDDKGNFINADAEHWYKLCAATKTFCELSFSGHGLHFLFNPSPDKFSAISNGKSGVLMFDKERDAKAELFYKTGGRHCLLTGNVYQCGPKAAIVKGVAADEVFETLLGEIAARQPNPPTPARAIEKKFLSQPAQIDSVEFDDFRARRMLDVLPVGDLHGNDWLVAMTAIKNLGFSYAEFDAMNQGGSNYNEAENRARWDSVTENGIGIGALYNLAVQYNYDAKDTAREWFQLHPELRPSKGKKLAAEMKQDLDDAIAWLKSLTPEAFTAADAHNSESLHAVALAAVAGFQEDAEKFFAVMQAAKKLAKARLGNTEFTQPLTEREELSLSALAEGVNIKSIRQDVAREVTAVRRAQNEYLKQAKLQEARAEAEKKRRQREQQVSETLSRIEELRAMGPSPERDDEIISLIRDSCDWHCDKFNRREYVKATAANINKIFTCDPNLDGLIGFDEFLQADVLLKSPTWRKVERGTEWSDRDDAQLQMYLRENYGDFANEKLTANALIKYSDLNRFHDVQDFFKSLPRWDGVKRAETLFIDWLKVADTPYSREVTLKWLLAAIARIFNPGCEFYWALTLHGAQKIGKSYILKRLGGKWYRAVSDRVDDPHVVDTIRLVWLGEFKEMSGMRKADVNAIKDFVELSADTRRLSYARRAGTYPRHCVFAVTVNDDEFLIDVTGNRRFLILDSNLKKFDWVKEVRGEKLSDDNVIAQIWAEVYHIYNEMFKNGFDERKLELSAAVEREGEEIAETYLRDDGLASEIKGFVDIKILPDFLWTHLTREERRDFFKNGKLVMLDACADFNRRRRAKGGKPDTVQRDVDLISDWLDGHAGRNFVHTERVTVQGREVVQYHIYGSELRQHICAAEIFNECFGVDSRKRMSRINEILSTLDGWHLGARLQNADTAYRDQKKVYYRDE